MKLHVFLMGGMLLLGACSTTLNKSQNSAGVHVSVSSDLHADLDIDTSRKIQGSAHHTKLFGFINIKKSQNYADGVMYDGARNGGGFLFFGPGMAEEAKAAAAYNAVVPAKADVLLAPQYLVREKSYFFGAWKEVTAQVTGWGAKIRNISQKNAK